MAITIHQKPQAWTPAYNDQWILALSDEIAQPLFKYKVEVTVYYDLNGTPSNEVFTYYVVPRPDGYLVFNAKEIVKNFVQHFMKPNEFGIVEAVNESVGVEVVIIETWTGEPGAASATADYIVWNACLTEKQMFSFSYGDYISSTVSIRAHSVATLGLLSYPFEKQTFLSDVFIHFVKPSTLDSINYKLIDTNGVDILNDVDLTGSMTNDKIYQINISSQLAEDTWGGVTVGMFIKVEFLTAANDVLYAYTYEIKELCTKHEVKRLYYLNRRGGVSSFPFELKSTKNVSKQTNDVKLNRNEIVSNTWTYKPYKHERNVVSTQETFSEVLNTNWITKLQSEYLEELFSSPMVWLVSEEDDYSDPYKFKPVVIADKSYEFKKHENEKLFNYSVLVEYSTTETRQRAI